MKLKHQPLEMMTTKEKERIHASSCFVLDQAGLRIKNARIIDALVACGAIYENGRISVPQSMVENALESVPGTIRFRAPDPDRSFTVDAAGKEVFLGTGGQALYVLRSNRGVWTRQPAGCRDLEEIVSLCQRLSKVDFITRPMECDVALDRMDEEKARIFASNTTKPMNLANLIDPGKLSKVIEIVGDPAYLSFIVCLVTSPLAVDDTAADKLLAISGQGIPVCISSCSQAGTTAPLSEVGELIQLNAEVLFGIVLVQAVNPGAPVLYRGIPITADLLSDGSPRWCQPESIRRVALAAEMCRYYGVPCCGTAGVSDEPVPSVQAVSEKAVSLTYQVAAGAQYINSAFGMLDRIMSVAPEQYVIDNMIAALVESELGKAQAFDERGVADAAVAAAKEAMVRSGVEVDELMDRELRSRVAFVNTRKEEYSKESMDSQQTFICSAVESPSSSLVFMKGARKGLRAGWLYIGKRIEAPLDISGLESKQELA